MKPSKSRPRVPTIRAGSAEQMARIDAASARQGEATPPKPPEIRPIPPLPQFEANS